MIFITMFMTKRIVRRLVEGPVVVAVLFRLQQAAWHIRNQAENKPAANDFHKQLHQQVKYR